MHRAIGDLPHRGQIPVGRRLGIQRPVTRVTDLARKPDRMWLGFPHA